jgi:sec-independent protein translocase protein TatB
VPLNLSFTHIIVVAIVALVVLGPERLPGVARTAGNLYREWKRISVGIEAEVRDVLGDFTAPLQEPINQIRESVNGATSQAAMAAPPSQPADGSISVPPLAPALPTLGPSTGLVSPGPVIEPTLPSLGPPPEPDTFVPGPGRTLD